jgi:acetyl esterase/lipase
MKYSYLLPKAVCLFNERLGQLTLYRPGKAKNVVYSRKIRYSEDKKLYLNLCTPAELPAGRLPVFVYIHGGGYVSGSPEQRETFVSRIAAAGFFTVNIFYGYAPAYGHPHSIRNIYDALAWLKNNQDKYNIDLDRLYMGGESAGAYFTAMAGAVSSNEEYRNRLHLNPVSQGLVFKGLILNCGIYDINDALSSGFPFMKAFMEAYYGKPLKYLKNDPDADLLSPARFLTKDFPPSFVLVAQHDHLKGGGISFAKKLDELGVRNVYHMGTGFFAVHAFLVAQCLPPSKIAMPKVMEFLLSGQSETKS